MKLEWGAERQLSFQDEEEYYYSLGIFSNPELTSIYYEDNAKRGSYTDAYRLKMRAAAMQGPLPNAIKKAAKNAGRINCNEYVINLMENHAFIISGNAITAAYEDVINTIPKDKMECIRAFVTGFDLLKKKTHKVSYSVDNIDVSSAELVLKHIPTRHSKKGKKPSAKSYKGKRDYISKTINDAVIGEAGERIVYENEKNKLIAAKAAGVIQDLKDKLEWVSLSDDSAGYDIKSFDIDKGCFKYIEVKSTTGNATQPFFMSENEMKKAKELGSAYYLYRLYNMNRQKVKTVEYYIVNGDITENESLEIRSNGYVVAIKPKE